MPVDAAVCPRCHAVASGPFPVPVRMPQRMSALGITLVVLLGLVMLNDVMTIAVALQRAALIGDVIENPATGDFDALNLSDVLTGYTAGGTLLLWLSTGILFIVWFAKARSNAVIYAPGSIRHKEPWVVLGWLVPFANLVIPKQIADDVWRASDVEGVPAVGGSRPRVSRLITVWWIAFIVSLAGHQASFIVFDPEASLSGLQLQARMDAGAATLDLVAAALAVVFVRRLTARQEQRSQRLAADLATGMPWQQAGGWPAAPVPDRPDARAGGSQDVAGAKDFR